MPCGVFETKDVEDSKVPEVVAGYKLDNPIKVEVIKQPGGKNTVRATFPPCPPATKSKVKTK